MPKHREQRKNRHTKSIKEMVYILVEGRRGNKSEKTYFNILNRIQKDKVLKTETKKTAISNDIDGTEHSNFKKVAVCDTDINETHTLETFITELQSYVKSGYTVYISNESWETWIKYHFEDASELDCYDKKEKWYLEHQAIFSDTDIISRAIRNSIQVCDSLSLPHGIAKSEDIQTFIREYKYCSNQPFTMVGFLLQSLIE